MKITRNLAAAVLSVALILPGAVSAMQAPAAAPAKAADSKAKKAVTPAASPADIDAAKAKGLVWVNTGTGVYHASGEFYGKTKAGKFMTEDDAKKAGYRAAKPSAAGKKAAAKTDATKK